MGFCLSVTSLRSQRAGLDKFAGKSKRQYGKSKRKNMKTYIFMTFENLKVNLQDIPITVDMTEWTA